MHVLTVYHSVNLGTHLPPGPSKPQPSNFFCPSGTEKLNKSPRQTKSPDDSNNNTYTDFKIAYKHVLIPSYIIHVI